MYLFPITVIDDFFPDVNKVFELAKTINYKEKAQTNWPGVTSQELLTDSHPDLANFAVSKIVNVFWDLATHTYLANATVDFQRIQSLAPYGHILNKGLIHSDDEYGVKLTAIAYLNDCSRSDVGTSFYEKKSWSNLDLNDEYLNGAKQYHATGVIPENFIEKVNRHRSQFKETMRIQNKANRIVIFPSGLFHSQTSYGDETRYTLRVFLKDLKTQSLLNPNNRGRFPLCRTNI